MTVEDNKDKFKIEDKDDSFRSGVTGTEANNSGFLLGFDKFKLELQDSSKSVFSDSTLPLTFDVNDFDSGHRKMELKFKASGGKELKIKGVIDSLAVISVPIPAAAWLFGSGLVALATLKRKRS